MNIPIRGGAQGKPSGMPDPKAAGAGRALEELLASLNAALGKRFQKAPAKVEVEMGGGEDEAAEGEGGGGGHPDEAQDMELIRRMMGR